MKLMRTAVIFFATGLTLLVCVPLGIVLYILGFAGLRRAVNCLMYKIGQGWASAVIAMTGCSMTVTGREHIPKRGGMCFVSNHVGVFDIILALAYAGRPFGFIAKKELLLLPGINLWIYLLGGLFLDRKRPRNALRTINRGVKRIRAGAAMLIFPEGTRSRGRGIGPFHPGSLKLASQSEAVIVPVAVTGSYDVFEKNCLVSAVPVSVSFLPPVYTAELPPADRKQILAERLHDSIAAELVSRTFPAGTSSNAGA